MMTIADQIILIVPPNDASPRVQREALRMIKSQESRFAGIVVNMSDERHSP